MYIPGSIPSYLPNVGVSSRMRGKWFGIHADRSPTFLSVVDMGSWEERHKNWIWQGTTTSSWRSRCHKVPIISWFGQLELGEVGKSG